MDTKLSEEAAVVLTSEQKKEDETAVMPECTVDDAFTEIVGEEKDTE